MLTAGFNTEIITPFIPVKLSGYAGTREATGVHDDLYARTFVIQSGSNLYSIVSLDLLSIDEALVDYVEKEAKYLGFKKNNIQIVATHTHSGPIGISDTNKGVMKGYEFFLGEKDDGYLKFVGQQIIESLKKSIDRLASQHIKIGRVEVSGISSNRSRPDQEYDNTLIAIEFENANGEKNLLIRFSNHPTVLPDTNTLITADFPSDLYERFASEYQNVLFMNGACGDISTRYTRESSDFTELERIGKIMQEKIEESLSNPAFAGEFDTVQFETTKIKALTKEPGDFNKLERHYDGVEDEQERISIYAEMMYAKYQTQREIELPVSVMKIHDLIFVLMPVEIFSTLTLNYIEEDIYYTSFANGYYTYLPDSLSYDYNEYEARVSPFMKGEGERVIEEVQEWIEGLDAD